MSRLDSLEALLTAARGWKKAIEANRTNWSVKKSKRTQAYGKKMFEILEALEKTK